jgi:hypothetical protein
MLSSGWTQAPLPYYLHAWSGVQPKREARGAVVTPRTAYTGVSVNKSV